ncbi:hypothetical protein WA158_004088 [Blastocystis sp. Blastoise]
MISSLKWSNSVSQSVTCTSTQTKVTLVRTFKSNCAEESFQIWEGSSSTGTLITSDNGISKENTVKNYELCLNPTMHTFVALDGDNNGWENGSTFLIKTPAGVILIQGTLDRYTRAEWSFYPSYTISSTSQWKYTSTAQSGTSWTTAAFSDASWTSYAPGSFPAPSTTTRYFRATGSIPADKTNFVSFEVGVLTREGVAIYVNGQEVYRRNLADSATSSTTASTTDANSAYRRATGPISSLTGTSVTVAVEIHGSGSNPASEDFKGFFIVFYGPCNIRSKDGTVASNHGNVGNAQETMNSAFDNDIQTLWYFGNVPVNLDYTFNDGRKEWINAYEITTGWQWDERRPKNWKVSASNDGTNWILLDYRTDMRFDARRDTKRFYLNTNNMRFNTYRWEVLSVQANSDGEIAEFAWVACNQPIQTPQLAYPQSSYTLVTNLDTVYLYPTQNGFTSFQINPSLPAGLSMDANSGTIKGKATVDTSATIYTITATHHTNVQSQTTITLTTYTCASPKLRVDIYKRTNKDSYDGWEQYIVKNAAGTIVWQYEVTASDYTDTINIKHYFCWEPGVYTITGNAHTSSGWAGTSYLAVDLYGRGSAYCISRFHLYKKQSETYKVNIAYETETSFKSMLTSTSIPTGWYSQSFNDAAWPAYTASASTPASSHIWFFRQTFTVASRTGAQSYEYRINVRSGSIVYLDGVEIHRINVATGALTMASYATDGRNNDESAQWRVITGKMSQLSAGTHVFATAVIHKSGYTSINSEFDGSLLISFDSDLNPRNVEMSGKQSSQRWSDSPASNLADQDYASRWASWVNTDEDPIQWAQISYNNYRTEYINKYCVVNAWDAPQQDPVKWTLKGSNDDTNFTDIDHEENVTWDQRTQRLCFYTPNNLNTYRHYRFVCEETSVAFPNCQSCIIAELEFYIVNYDTLSVPALDYNPKQINGYVNVDFPTTLPTSEYYHSFTITPALPAGVVLTPGNGRILGRPTTPASGTYTVSALNPQGVTSTSLLTINIATCNYPSSVIKFSATGFESDAYQNGYYIENTMGTQVASYPQFPRWANEITASYCLAAGSYKLVLLDNGNNGWEKGSLVISLEDGTVIIRASVQYGESPKAIPFTVGNVVAIGAASWSYYSGSEPAANWYDPAYTPSWPVATAGHFTGLSGVTQYYRTSFTMTNINQYVIYEITTLLKAGAVIYLNGKQINKINLPSTVKSTTMALKEFSEVTKVTSAGSIQFGDLKDGANVLAVEIHRFSDIPETTFDAYVHVETSGSYRAIDGTYSTNAPGYKTDSYDEREYKAFDGSYSAKYFSNRCMVENEKVYLQWTYNNNRRDYVNSITFVRSTDNGRVPKDFEVLASNDGTTWDSLVVRTGVVLDKYNSLTGKVTLDFYTTKNYNAYRLTMYSSDCNQGYEVAEVILNSKRLDNYCAADNGFTIAADGQIATKKCQDWYDGAISRLCTNGVWGTEETKCTIAKPLTLLYDSYVYIFKTNKFNTITAPVIRAVNGVLSLESTLPVGITFDEKTGIISGTPVVDFNTTQVIIKTTNSAGESLTTLTLSSITEVATVSGGIITLIVLAAIVLIVGVCLLVWCILIRVKSSKKGNHTKLEKKPSATKKPSGNNKTVKV